MNIKNINFRLTDEEYNVLQSMCERNQLSIGSQIRDIVKDAIYYEIASSNYNSEMSENEIQISRYGKASGTNKNRSKNRSVNTIYGEERRRKSNSIFRG